MRVVWTKAAVEDLRKIEEFIATDSPYYARGFIRKILSSTRNLEAFSRIGRKVPEVDADEIREIIVNAYRIIYHLQMDRIQILTVVHGSRMLDLQGIE